MNLYKNDIKIQGSFNQKMSEIQEKLKRVQKELDQIDVEFDYYEFANEKAEQLFIDFCNLKGI